MSGYSRDYVQKVEIFVRLWDDAERCFLGDRIDTGWKTVSSHLPCLIDDHEDSGVEVVYIDLRLSETAPDDGEIGQNVLAEGIGLFELFLPARWFEARRGWELWRVKYEAARRLAPDIVRTVNGRVADWGPIFGEPPARLPDIEMVTSRPYRVGRGGFAVAEWGRFENDRWGRKEIAFWDLASETAFLTTMSKTAAEGEREYTYVGVEGQTVRSLIHFDSIGGEGTNLVPYGPEYRVRKRKGRMTVEGGEVEPIDFARLRLKGDGHFTSKAALASPDRLARIARQRSTETEPLASPDDLTAWGGVNERAHSLLREAFFWDPCDPDGPFGTDEGDQALEEYRDWAARHPEGRLCDFLDQAMDGRLAEYGPSLLTDERIEADLDDPEASFLGDRWEPNVLDITVIASGLGQLLVSGRIDEEAKPFLRVAVRRQAHDAVVPNRHRSRVLAAIERVIDEA